MENDLIRRSEAQKPFDKTGWKNQRLEGYEVWHMLDDVPVVDAVEVVHADWVCRFVAGHVEVRCSKCGEHRPPAYMSSDYCSKFGARMDGEEDNNAAD